MNWLDSIQAMQIGESMCLSAGFAVSALIVIWKRSSGPMRME